MKEKKELTEKEKKTIEGISKFIAVAIGAGFIYWVLIMTEVI